MRLFVRADGSREVGLGHVMRSLAVAEEALARGIECSYVMVDGLACGLVERRGFRVTRLGDAQDQSWLDALQRGDRVLFDGYGFLGDGTPSLAHARGVVVGVVDDHDGADVHADVVVNPNDVDPARYPNAAVACCGPQYAMVRSEFVPYRRRRTGSVTLLATFGGSDAAGLTERALDALDEDEAAHAFSHVVLLAGPASPEPAPRPWLEVVRDPADVAAVFDRADAALSAAGSTTWELLCLGIPCALVEVAENQRLVASTAAAGGGALALGTVEDALIRIPDAIATLAQQTTMTDAALATVDGLGASRVLDALVRHFPGLFPLK